MQTISDSEISSRGLAALEKMLDNGPVQAINDERLAYFVLTQAEYSRLKTRRTPGAGNRADVWASYWGRSLLAFNTAAAKA